MFLVHVHKLAIHVKIFSLIVSIFTYANTSNRLLTNYFKHSFNDSFVGQGLMSMGLTKPPPPHKMERS